jgi:hypothetical protein
MDHDNASDTYWRGDVSNLGGDTDLPEIFHGFPQFLQDSYR